MALKIVTDSTSYLPEDLKRDNHISTVSLCVSFGSESQREEDVDATAFYARMARTGELPVSSQPAIGEMADAFRRITSAGDASLGIFLSEEMSGTIDCAHAARKIVREEDPTAQIEILDSRSNCMQLGFAALAAARAARAGAAVEEAVAAARAVMARSRFLFVPRTLEYLRRGGRMGGASALLGTLLHVRPILTVVDGRTAVLRKVRTQARAVGAMLDELFEGISEKGLGDIVVHHIHSEAAGRRLAALIEDRLGRAVRVCPIGPVIGLHVGPGAVGVVYYTAD
jgi:DegV family protein with EDD domain